MWPANSAYPASSYHVTTPLQQRPTRAGMLTPGSASGYNGQKAWMAPVPNGNAFINQPLTSNAPANGLVMKKQKRFRTAYTTAQLSKLEEEYRQDRFIKADRRKQLATSTNVSDRSIKIWFQNRRMKEKKEYMERQAQSNLNAPCRHDHIQLIENSNFTMKEHIGVYESSNSTTEENNTSYVNQQNMLLPGIMDGSIIINATHRQDDVIMPQAPAVSQGNDNIDYCFNNMNLYPQAQPFALKPAIVNDMAHHIEPLLPAIPFADQFTPSPVYGNNKITDPPEVPREPHPEQRQQSAESLGEAPYSELSWIRDVYPIEDCYQ